MQLIQPFLPEQLPQLAALEVQTFSETFEKHYTAADFAAYLQASKTETALAQELAQPGCYSFLLNAGGVNAGFIQVHLHKQPDHATTLPAPVMEIAKIYVLKAFQHQHLGQALLQHALGFAATHAVHTVWLGVWEHNTQAIAFYQRHGFVQFGAHPFRVGTQVDNDWLMKKQI